MKSLAFLATGLFVLSAGAAEYYVNCNLQDYTGHDGTTPEKAYETIQQAVGRPNGSIIHVAPGRYDKGLGRATTHWWLQSRVSITDKNLTFIADEGASKTFIVGAHDPETGNFGPGAIRCVDVLDNGFDNQVIFKGFTLCDGATANVAKAMPGDGGAALITNGSSGGHSVYFIDCVVSNCIGSVSTIYGGTWIRAHVTHNDITRSTAVSSTTGFNNAWFLSSVFSHNRHLSAAGEALSANIAFVTGCKVINCTLVANGCTFWGNSPIYKYNSLVSAANFDGATATEVNNVYDTVDKFLLIAPRLGDWRVRAGSAADGTADKQYLTADVIPLPDELESERYKDFYGRTFDPEGSLMMGAVQETATQVAGAIRFSDTNATFGDPSFATTVQDYVIPTAYPTNYLIRPIGQDGGQIFSCRYSYNGVAESSPRYPSVGSGFWVTPAPSASTTLALGVTPATAVVYADAQTKESLETQDGSIGHPFKTLQQAASGAAAKTIIVALPGVYDEGEMKIADTDLIPRRVVLKNTVMLVSRDGADVTTIKGRKSDVAPDPNNVSAEKFIEGLGPNAVGCVYLDNTSILRGFTLTSGYTRGVLADGSVSHGSSDTNGGGAAGSGSVYDCVLTDCAGYRGGAGFNACFYNCVFDGNKSIYGGGATSGAYHFGCLAKNNVCTENARYGWNSFFYWAKVENCTILDAMGGPQTASAVLKNTLVWGDVGTCDWQSKDSFSSANYVNCIFADRATGYVRQQAYHDKIVDGAGCRIVSPDELLLDADGRPVVGACAAINAGNLSVTSYLSEMDVLGGQRIYDGVIDVGALEGDWRGQYAQDLSRYLVGTQASPEVVEADGKVRLTDGTTFAARYARALEPTRKIKYALNTTVSGAGALSVSVDGQLVATLTAGSAKTEIQVGADSRIDFAFEGEGFADIGRMQSGSGAFFFVR